MNDCAAPLCLPSALLSSWLAHFRGYLGAQRARGYRAARARSIRWSNDERAREHDETANSRAHDKARACGHFRYVLVSLGQNFIEFAMIHRRRSITPGNYVLYRAGAVDKNLRGVSRGSVPRSVPQLHRPPVH